MKFLVGLYSVPQMLAVFLTFYNLLILLMVNFVDPYICPCTGYGSSVGTEESRSNRCYS